MFILRHNFKKTAHRIVKYLASEGPWDFQALSAHDKK